jgi:transposase
MITHQKKYSKEYKIKAVELSKQRGSMKAISDELGISAKNISRWNKEYESGKYSENYIHSNSKSKEQLENIALRKALRDAELERDILKKALGIFSKSDR